MAIDLAIWAEYIELLRDFYLRYFDMTCGELYHNPKKKFSSYFLRFADGGASIELMNIPGKDAPTSRSNLKRLAQFAISVGSKEKVDSYVDLFRADGYIPSLANRELPETVTMNVQSPTLKAIILK